MHLVKFINGTGTGTDYTMNDRERKQLKNVMHTSYDIQFGYEFKSFSLWNLFPLIKALLGIRSTNKASCKKRGKVLIKYNGREYKPLGVSAFIK